jgi:hypothetical protein
MWQKGKISFLKHCNNLGGWIKLPSKNRMVCTSCQYIHDQSANEDNPIVAKGYYIHAGAINYTQPKYEAGQYNGKYIEYNQE